jgi:hypothetical protein
MNRQVYVGLAVLGSGGDDDLNTTTFTDVSVTTLAPTVATPAKASPATVTVGGTTNLSVLGADDGGESNLTYTWTTTALPSGAPAPTLGANGTNAAKNTTATFRQAGSYTLTVTITDVGGRSTTSSVAVTVAAPTVTAAGYDFRHALSFTFTTDVSGVLSTGDLSVQALAGGATSTPDSVSWDGGTKTATFTFAAPLADGNYRAALASAGYTYDFFSLAGDANRDRVINFADLLAVTRNYNKAGATWADGDFTGDGTVNFDDLLIVARNYNKAVAAPAPVVASAAPVTAAVSAAGDLLTPKDSKAPVFSTTRVAKPAPPSKPKPAPKPAKR